MGVWLEARAYSTHCAAASTGVGLQVWQGERRASHAIIWITSF